MGSNLIFCKSSLRIAQNPKLGFRRAVPYRRAVRVIQILPLLTLGFLLGTPPHAQAGGAQVKKVLPHLLDREGRHALSPSLFERDAYQAHLRTHPELCSGLRLDVNWKARDTGRLRLSVELRGSLKHKPTSVALEEPVQRRGLFSTWSRFHLTGADYERLGELTAWRATLWDGDTILAEQKSFLW